MTKAVAVLGALIAAHMPQVTHSWQTIFVDECADIVTLNQALQVGGGVTARMTSEVSCTDEGATTWTTVEVPESSRLFVKLATGESSSTLTFVNVRFEVASRDSGRVALTFVPDIEFHATIDDQVSVF